LPASPDRMVHGVESDRFRSTSLLETAAMHLRKDVGEEDKLAIGKGGRDCGFPVAENTEVGVDRLGGREVVVVFPEPAEGTALRVLDAGEVDALRAKTLEVAPAEVVTDNAHEPDRRVEACGQRKIRSGAAEDVAAAVVGGVHVGVGPRADDEDVRRHREADVSWWGRAGPRARARCSRL